MGVDKLGGFRINLDAAKKTGKLRLAFFDMFITVMWWMPNFWSEKIKRSGGIFLQKMEL